MTEAASTELADRVRRWIAADPDPQDRAELTELLSRSASDPAAAAEIRDRFAGDLEFGTAGLRGPMAAGPRRMNRAVVIRASAGLAAYLTERRVTGPVVVGYDARHRSRRFAEDAAGVLAGAGLDVAVLPGALPTPVLAFAVRRHAAAAGVMVTASHNPAADNGFKVYLSDGCQIAPPTDEHIAGLIAAAPAANEIRLVADWQILPADILDEYVAAVASLPASHGPRDLRVAYTPLHGVGAGVVVRALKAAGFSAPHVVAAQAAPDPAFPTVAFPNPEEPGALDQVIALATESGADLALANDPDADRCAVAVPTVGGWRMLHGDEVGVLLADHLLRRGRRGTFATTIVSSSMLSALARRRGVEYAETFTGFKWIARVPRLAFGYEEALGYCVAPDIVADKDGIAALLLVCELAAGLRADGRTLTDRLDELAAELGVFATEQIALPVASAAAARGLLDTLRDAVGDAEDTALGGFAVTSIRDLRNADGELPPTDGLRLELGGHGRVVVRPSGTEPKLKCYLEIVVPVAESVEAARIAAAGRLDAVRADLRVMLTRR